MGSGKEGWVGRERIRGKEVAERGEIEGREGSTWIFVQEPRSS